MGADNGARMGWYREVSKMCLNLGVLTVGVTGYGVFTNPNWQWWHLPLGGMIFIALLVLSFRLWGKGGES